MPSIFKLAAALALTLTLAGCQDAMKQLNRDLAAANASMAGAKPGTMASLPSAGKEQQTQLTVPTETRTREAMEAALPTVKKVLSIHQCVKVGDGMLQLNSLAVPGVNFTSGSFAFYNFPNADVFMKYHDRNKCVSVRAIDNWAMPALNALQFRAVYFADDSGETVSFSYLMKRINDGSWKLQTIQRIS